MTTSAARQRYWLGDSRPEVDHLLAQAEFLGPDAVDLLSRIGVAPGASVIDIGCGVLGILPQLRSRVGDSGRVVGLDVEPRLLAAAGQLSARHDLAVETVRADAASTGLPPDSFDLVHERMPGEATGSPPAEPAQLIALYRESQPLMVKRPSRKSGGAWTGQTSWDKPLGKNTIEFHSGAMDAGAPYIPAGPGLWKISSPPLNG
jgi:SAM-dependent methyltransferase